MATTLNLTITLNSTTMQTEGDVRNALMRSFTNDDYYLENTDGAVIDDTGAEVGSWSVSTGDIEEAPAPVESLMWAHPWLK